MPVRSVSRTLCTAKKSALIDTLRLNLVALPIQLWRHLGTRPGNLSSPSRWQTS